MKLLTANQLPVEYNRGLVARLFQRIDDYFNRIAPHIAVTKTASFQLGADETRIICNGSGTITVTLPNAATYNGPDIHIKTIAAFTVVSASANVIPLAGGAAGTAILAATAGRWAVLTTNGANWIIAEQGNSATGLPAGSDTQVQFNDGGAFGGDADFTWDKTNNILTIGNASSGYLGSPSAVSSNTAGSGFTLFTGDGLGSGTGGVLYVLAGEGGATGAGGAAATIGGTGGATTGDGGASYTQGGAAQTSGHGGSAYLVGGGAQGGAGKHGGHCLLQPGAGNGGDAGQVMVGSGSALATTSTGGFFCLPTCAGTPTGTPANVQAGSIAMVYDTTNNKLYAYNGAWKAVTLA